MIPEQGWDSCAGNGCSGLSRAHSSHLVPPCFCRIYGELRKVPEEFISLPSQCCSKHCLCRGFPQLRPSRQPFPSRVTDPSPWNPGGHFLTGCQAVGRICLFSPSEDGVRGSPAHLAVCPGCCEWHRPSSVLGRTGDVHCGVLWGKQRDGGIWAHSEVWDRWKWHLEPSSLGSEGALGAVKGACAGMWHKGQRAGMD